MISPRKKQELKISVFPEMVPYAFTLLPKYAKPGVYHLKRATGDRDDFGFLVNTAVGKPFMIKRIDPFPLKLLILFLRNMNSYYVTVFMRSVLHGDKKLKKILESFYDQKANRHVFRFIVRRCDSMIRSQPSHTLCVVDDRFGVYDTFKYDEFVSIIDGNEVLKVKMLAVSYMNMITNDAYYILYANKEYLTNVVKMYGLEEIKL